MDSLAAGSFDDVVFGAHEDDAARARVVGPADVHKVGAGDVFRVGAFIGSQQADERSILVGSFECFPDLGRVGSGFQFCAGGGADACVDGDEVRREGDDDFFSGGGTEFLFDFAQVAVFRYAVGTYAFIAFTEEEEMSALRPAPLTPLDEQTTMPSVSSSPAFSRGMSGRRMLVG